MDLKNTNEILSQNHVYDWTKEVWNNRSWNTDIKNRKYYENKLYVCFVNKLYLTIWLSYARLSKNNLYELFMYQSNVLIMLYSKYT